MHVLIRYVLECKGGEVEVIETGTPVIEAVRRMNRRGIGSLVVTSGSEVVGILTERDVLTRVVGEQRDPEVTAVEDVMTRNVSVIDAEATVADAMTMITDRRCRHLPVIERGRLRGLVSSGDLTKWLLRDHALTISELQDYIAR